MFGVPLGDHLFVHKIGTHTHAHSLHTCTGEYILDLIMYIQGSCCPVCALKCYIYVLACTLVIRLLWFHFSLLLYVCRFMGGGWPVLNAWLAEAKKNQDFAVLVEVLQVCMYM